MGVTIRTILVLCIALQGSVAEHRPKRDIQDIFEELYDWSKELQLNASKSLDAKQKEFNIILDDINVDEKIKELNKPLKQALDAITISEMKICADDVKTNFQLFKNDIISQKSQDKTDIANKCKKIQADSLLPPENLQKCALHNIGYPAGFISCAKYVISDMRDVQNNIEEIDNTMNNLENTFKIYFETKSNETEENVYNNLFKCLKVNLVKVLTELEKANVKTEIENLYKTIITDDDVQKMFDDIKSKIDEIKDTTELQTCNQEESPILSKLIKTYKAVINKAKDQVTSTEQDDDIKKISTDITEIQTKHEECKTKEDSDFITCLKEIIDLRNTVNNDITDYNAGPFKTLKEQITDDLANAKNNVMENTITKDLSKCETSEAQKRVTDLVEASKLEDQINEISNDIDVASKEQNFSQAIEHKIKEVDPTSDNTQCTDKAKENKVTEYKNALNNAKDKFTALIESIDLSKITEVSVLQEQLNECSSNKSTLFECLTAVFKNITPINDYIEQFNDEKLTPAKDTLKGEVDKADKKLQDILDEINKCAE